VDLTVACVLRSGGAYRAEHVAGLMAQVQHWMPGVRFVCLSDVPVPCERAQMASAWPGWWSKVELFRHFSGRTLYLDLDSVIVNDPAPLVTDAFAMIRNWNAPALFASGVMAWDGDYSHITDAFEPVARAVMATYVTQEKWGDQAFIAEHAGNVQAFPDGAVASYRYQAVNWRYPPRGMRIVAFNGTHPPWNGPRWARRWWAPQALAA
jgi:hypothetical protein